MYINPNNYEVQEDCVKLIVIYKKSTIETIFDKDDFEKITKYHWKSSKKKNKVYISSGQNKGGSKTIYMQNVICNFIPDGKNEVDHIDGNSLNNLRSNLRIVSRIENIHNSSARIDNKTTGIRGVSFDKRYSVFTVDFHYNKKRFYIKTFKKIEEAVYARFLLEKIFLKELRYIGDDDNKNKIISKLSSDEKIAIEEYLKEKIL